MNGATETYKFSFVSKYGIEGSTGLLEIDLPVETVLLDDAECRAYCVKTGEELICTAIAFASLDI